MIVMISHRHCQSSFCPICVHYYDVPAGVEIKNVIVLPSEHLLTQSAVFLTHNPKAHILFSELRCLKKAIYNGLKMLKVKECIEHNSLIREALLPHSTPIIDTLNANPQNVTHHKKASPDNNRALQISGRPKLIAVSQYFTLPWN